MGSRPGEAGLESITFTTVDGDASLLGSSLLTCYDRLKCHTVRV